MSRFGAIGFSAVASRVYSRRTSDGAAILGARIATQIAADRRDFDAPHPADTSADRCIERLRLAGATKTSARPRQDEPWRP
jgi:hypothetical protein